ncbi:MAG: 50S ribosomal protein L30 [Thermodesulfobacteriota bacterium]
MSSILKVTLIRSISGRPEKHIKVLKGMGLTKINKSIEFQDTPANRGMVRKVSHLVKVEEK